MDSSDGKIPLQCFDLTIKSKNLILLPFIML